MDLSEGRAIPFIAYHERKGYVLTEEAEQFLNSLTDPKLGIISVVGKYRTGKSFFINRVLLNQKKSGFNVGPTINPCTKGLWLWSKTLKTENAEEGDLTTLLIDTEGFGGIDESQNHDTKIFLFSLLLSSFFIYNSVGSIDENALNNLSLIINLAKDIQFKASGGQTEGEDVSQYFPSFLWIIRDFALRLVDSTNNPITPKEYLESALQPQKGVSDSVESKNRVRRMLKHFFRERDCNTMVRPVENEKELQRLDEMDEESFRPEFVDQLRNIRKKIFKKVKPKTLNGKFLTGPMLAEICKAYIEAINSGRVPNIENAWTYLCQQESYKALTQTMSNIDEELSKVGTDTLNDEQLKELKTRIKEGIVSQFKKKSMGSEEEVKTLVEGLNKKFNEKFAQFKENNDKKWKVIYLDWLEKKNEELEEKAQKDQYSSFYEFEKDFDNLKEAYEKEMPAGPSKAGCFSEFAEKALVRAAELISKKQEQQFQNNSRRMAAKLEMTENQLMSKTKEIEEDRKNLYQKIQEIEKEKATFTAEKQTLKNQLEDSQREKERIERKYNDLAEEYRLAKEKFSKISEEELTELKNRLEKAQTERMQSQSDHDKNHALLEQELNFTRRDNENLQRKIESLEEENRRMRVEYSDAHRTTEGLRQKLSDNEMNKHQEINTLKLELDRKMMDLANETDKRKDNVKAQSEWLMEKTYLENQVSFLKNQLEENKRLHDALLMALEQGLNNGESEATNELVETNRHLSAAVDKMEARCKILEEKIEKSKRFKRMVKNSSALQCVNCSKFISTNIFLQHIANCVNLNGTQQGQHHHHHHHLFNSLSNTGNYSNNYSNGNTHAVNSPYSGNYPVSTPTSHAANYDNSPISATQSNSVLQISINQTMVKESSDSKPYTEYLIQITHNSQKWSVSRKYKMFCELHQTLTSSFPSLKFPESNFTGMSAFTNIGHPTTSKRPTVIEERRKALQQYLRDMAKIDIIRNSQPFRKFMELDRMNETSDTNVHMIEKGRIYPNGNQSAVNSNREDCSFNGKRTNIATPLHNGTQELHAFMQEGNNYNSVYPPPKTSTVSQGGSRRSLHGEQLTDEEETISQKETKQKVDKRVFTQSPHSFMRNWQQEEKTIDKENKNPRSVSENQNFSNSKQYPAEDDSNLEQFGDQGWNAAKGAESENDLQQDGKSFLNQLKSENVAYSQPQALNNSTNGPKNVNVKLNLNDTIKQTHSRNSSNSMLNGSEQSAGSLYSTMSGASMNSRNNTTAVPRYTPESNKSLAQKNYRNLKNTAISNSPASPQKYLFKPNMERGGNFKEYQRDNSSLNNSRNFINGNNPHYTIKN